MTCFTWPLRVYYEDTDASGVVYHANYLKYFERARSEWLRAQALTHQRLRQDHGCAFTLTEITVRYKKPAKLDDELIATVAIAHIGRARLTFAQTLYRAEQPMVLLAEAQATVVCVNAESFKPCAWPPGWLPTSP